MPLLTPYLIRRIQLAANRFMIDTCKISRLSGTPRVLTTISAAEPCFVRSVGSGRDPGWSEIEDNQISKELTVKVTTNLFLGDQILHNGITYEVYSVSTDETPNIKNTALMRLAKR